MQVGAHHGEGELIRPAEGEILIPIYSNAACRKLRNHEHEKTDNMMCAGYGIGEAQTHAIIIIMCVPM